MSEEMANTEMDYTIHRLRSIGIDPNSEELRKKGLYFPTTKQPKPKIEKQPNEYYFDLFTLTYKLLYVLTGHELQ